MSQGIRHNQGKPQVADRYNTGKERWTLVDFDALKPMVHVLEFGAKKYSDDNWKKGLKTKEICESLIRHLTAYLSGQDNDAESGLPEVGHILCNAMFLSYMAQFRPDMDTRSEKSEKVCCGKWDEYGKCICVDNRREKEEPKGGVLDESNFRQIAEDFADRLPNFKERVPMSTIEFNVNPEIFKHDIDDQLIVSHLGQKFKCVVRSIKGCSDGYITPTLEIIGHAESEQNANIGRTYPKEEQWIDINKNQPLEYQLIEYRNGDNPGGQMWFNSECLEFGTITHWRPIRISEKHLSML